jgi:hypothetical protein
MIIIAVSFIPLFVNWYNNRLLPLIRQLFLILNNINEFMDLILSQNLPGGTEEKQKHNKPQTQQLVFGPKL